MGNTGKVCINLGAVINGGGGGGEGKDIWTTKGGGWLPKKCEKKGWATKNLSVVVGKNQGSVIIYSQGGGYQYTINTYLQQLLAFISKHCVNMKYFGLCQQ